MTPLLATLILTGLTGAGTIAMAKQKTVQAKRRLIPIPVPAESEPRPPRTRRVG